MRGCNFLHMHLECCCVFVKLKSEIPGLLTTNLRIIPKTLNSFTEADDLNLAVPVLVNFCK